jgi:hypothetical protein
MARLTPQAFAEKWSVAAFSERASYQQHFLDLCAMLDQPAPAEADPRGEFYAFEKGVEKTGGGKGFANVCHEMEREDASPGQVLPPEEVAAFILWLATSPPGFVLTEGIITPIEEGLP